MEKIIAHIEKIPVITLRKETKFTPETKFFLSGSDCKIIGQVHYKGVSWELVNHHDAKKLNNHDYFVIITEHHEVVALLENVPSIVFRPGISYHKKTPEMQCVLVDEKTKEVLCLTDFCSSLFCWGINPADAKKMANRDLFVIMAQ